MDWMRPQISLTASFNVKCRAVWILDSSNSSSLSPHLFSLNLRCLLWIFRDMDPRARMENSSPADAFLPMAEKQDSTTSTSSSMRKTSSLAPSQIVLLREQRARAECIGRAISDANSGVGEFVRHVLADVTAHKLVVKLSTRPSNIILKLLYLPKYEICIESLILSLLTSFL